MEEEIFGTKVEYLLGAAGVTQAENGGGGGGRESIAPEFL
jgi:hypothetical protein